MNSITANESSNDTAFSIKQVGEHDLRAGDESLRYLSPEEYPKWDALVELSPQGSVFCRSWWLQAIGDGVRVLGCFQNGSLVAGMPLYTEKRFGMSVCRMPKLTQTWGIVMEPLSGKTATMTTREMSVMGLFANHLAKEKIFYQVFHPTLQNWLPFYWNGFKQTSRVTYVIDDLTRLDHVWEQISKNRRTKIRKAEKFGLTVQPCTADLVFDMVHKTFERQSRKVPFSRTYLNGLYSAAVANGAGECFAAIDNSGRPHAASFVIWDKNRFCDLVSGADPDVRSSESQSFLLWKMIELAAQRSKVYDFTGSVLPTVEPMFRQFGAKQVPLNWIMKFPLWLLAALSLRGKL